MHNLRSIRIKMPFHDRRSSWGPFTKTNQRPLWRVPIRTIIFPLLILSMLLASCQAGNPPQITPDQAGSTSNPAVVTPRPVQDPCDSLDDLTFSHLAIDNAALMPALNADFTTAVLGLEGAKGQAKALILGNSFCRLTPSKQAQDLVTRFNGLIQTGNQQGAQDLLGGFLSGSSARLQNQAGVALLGDAFFTFLVAPSVTVTSADEVRQQVLDDLTAAAEAQMYGYDDLAEAAIQKASGTYAKWAGEAINHAVSVNEAATIAMEAGLLGLDDLMEQGLTRASELALTELQQAINAFDPCTAKPDDLKALLGKLATASLLSVADTDDGGTYFDAVMEKYELTRDILQRKSQGQPVPQCESWSLTMSFANNDESGTGRFEWQGQFNVNQDHQLTGQGTGKIWTHADDFPCVDPNAPDGLRKIGIDITGSFPFSILGTLEEKKEGPVFNLVIEGGQDDTLQTTLSDPECEFDNENLVSGLTIGIAKYPAALLADRDETTNRITIPARDGYQAAPATFLNVGHFEIQLEKVTR